MNDFNEEQKNFIEKLESTKKIFDEIIAKDKNGMVIPFGEERNKLSDLIARHDNILRKLKTREFTVAVVGLEKAGKSTLGNALLKRNILPEYTERCTYTTTKISAGKEDKGEIYFYKESDFKKDFADKLKNQLKCEQFTDFDTIDLKAFNRWWESMADKEPAIYEKHNTTTFKDIQTMIEKRSELKKFLGHENMVFRNDELESENFKIFITGILGKDENEVVIRAPHPYAVEKVIIESSKLDLNEIVLYDVPGFNSPTELHKKQTLDMLRKADAIILVTNVGLTPNLDSSQLGMLRQGRDEENIPLTDKAFVFGNQIDRAANATVAKRNIAVLRKDSLENKIAKENHIFFGAAKAHLENEGIESSDEALKGSTKSKDTMDSWQMTYGIDELWAGMREYYNTDRFEILRRRANNVIAETKDFLDSILEKYESSEWQPIETGGEYYLEATRKLTEFKRAAYDITQSHNEEINADKPFSKMVCENIEKFFPEQNKDSELLAKIKREGNIYTGAQLAITRIDSTFREELMRVFLRNIIEETAEMTEQREREIYEEINAKFLEVMGMSAGSPYKAELTKSVDKLFQSLWIKNADRCRFNSLVERFTSDLLEALIMTPFASPDRFIKVNDSYKEFCSLATYYENYAENPETDNNDRQIEFFSKILLHENADTDPETQGSLKNFFTENKDAVLAGLSIAIEFLPLGKWAKLLLKGGIKLQEMPNALKKKLEGVFYKTDWAKLSKDERVSRLTDAISSYVAENSKISGRLTKEKLKIMHNASKVNEITNEDEMLNVLNEDISILREFILQAVVAAIGLDHAFVSVMTKNINIIRKDEETAEGAKIFDDWIMANIRKIKVNEFGGLDQRNLDNQTRKNIVESVRKVTDKLLEG